MNITDKAQQYSDQFISAKRDNGKSYVYLKDDAAEELRESIRRAHDGKFPDDWIYGAYADLMQRVAEYDIKNEEQLQDARHEIVDGYVDTYTSDLTKWLHSDNSNVDYLERAIKEFGTPESGWQLLASAQYLAIDEVMNYVYDLLIEGN